MQDAANVVRTAAAWIVSRALESGEALFQAQSPTDVTSLFAQFIFRSRACERCRATKQVLRTDGGRRVRSVVPANANISTPAVSPDGEHGPSGGLPRPDSWRRSSRRRCCCCCNGSAKQYCSVTAAWVRACDAADGRRSAAVPGDCGQPSDVQSSTAGRPPRRAGRPPLPWAPINLDRRQARKRRCGDVTPAILIRASQPVASLLVLCRAMPHAAIDKQDSDFTAVGQAQTGNRTWSAHSTTVYRTRLHESHSVSHLSNTQV